jgi:hypothetical protein
LVRHNFGSAQKKAAARALAGRRLQKTATLAVDAALPALLAALSGLVLATLLLLTGLILPALLRLTGFVLATLLRVALLLVALRVVLFVRHRDVLRM